MIQTNLLIDFGEIFSNLWNSMGIAQGTWQNYVMLLISFLLMYLAIVKKYEPMLLLPIAFGMFLINIPGAEKILWGTYPEGVEETYDNTVNRGLLWYLYFGVDKVIYPPLIFLGIGAMTDFGPLIANPKSMLIGAGAQLGIFIALFGGIVGMLVASRGKGLCWPYALMQYGMNSNKSEDLLAGNYPSFFAACLVWLVLLFLVARQLLSCRDVRS